jgi:hypothetical protein
MPSWNRDLVACHRLQGKKSEKIARLICVTAALNSKSFVQTGCGHRDGHETPKDT